MDRSSTTGRNRKLSTQGIKTDADENETENTFKQPVSTCALHSENLDFDACPDVRYPKFVSYFYSVHKK